MHLRIQEPKVLIDFPDITLIRLAPYSPMLNPIEGAWSAIKANIKNLNAARLPQVLAPNAQGALTLTEWRLRSVENLINEAKDIVTPMMCLNLINHTNVFYAPALALQDMQFGN